MAIQKPPKSFFIGNRRALKKQAGDSGPIVVAANALLQKSADSAYPFTQDGSFWYLTGLDEPGLIVCLDTDGEYIILPKVDVVRETFDGGLNKQELQEISGITTVLDNEDGWQRLSVQLKKSKSVATLEPSPAYIEQLAMFTNPARTALIEAIKQSDADITIHDLRAELSKLRSVKQPIEIELIEQAIQTTHELYKTLETKRGRVRSEADLMAELMYFAAKEKVAMAYDPVIASGLSALTLHYVHNQAPLDPRQFLLIDAGVRQAGYSADITRTVVNHPTKRQQQVYNAVLGVQEYALNLIKPGLEFSQYERLVMEFMGEKLRELGLVSTISKEAVREFYPHSTSHFLGIDVHDTGDYSQPLAEDMVLTVEPGIYIKKEGIGVRLEDNIVVTAEGYRNLSSAIPKTIDRLA